SEVAVVAECAGEHRHALESFGLEFVPHHSGVGIGSGRVSYDELDGHMTGCDLGEELAVEAELGVGVGLVSDSAQRGPLEHRYVFDVTSDREVEDGFREAGFVVERLVDGLYGHTGGEGDCRHGGGRQPALEDAL